MDKTQQPTPRILVIANRTCPCPTLVDEVARARFDIPVAHLDSSYGLLQEDIPA